MHRLAVAAALLVSAARLRAQAATYYPGLAATFLAPTGTIGPTDIVPVWLRLSLAPNAPALSFNAFASTPNFGLPAGLVPTTGRAPDGTTATFASYRAPETTVGFGCPNGFGPLATPPGIPPAPCGGTAYLFTPNTVGGAPSFFFLRNFALLPGNSFDFQVGTFAPQGAGAPAGSYELDYLAPSIIFFGADSAGRQLTATTQLARTCPVASGPDCAFVRTVAGSAVAPEPSTYVLLGAGLLAVGGVTRRRRVSRV